MRSRFATIGATVVAVATVGTYATTSSSAGRTAHGAASLAVAMVASQVAVPVTDANWAGAQKVARALGITVDCTGPSAALAIAQVPILNSMIAQHYDVIALAPDDANVPDAVLEKAMKAGIKVVTYGTDVNPAARNFFIQGTAYNTIAQSLVDATVKFTGPKASIAIMSSTPAATIQFAWASAIKSYVRTKYPGLQIVTIGYGDSVQSTSMSQAENIIRAYPAVKAILPIDGAAVAGTADAVQALGDAGKVGVFGIGDPLPNRSYFADNTLQALFLWDEVKQGELTMYVAKLAAEHRLQPGGSFNTPLGRFTVTAKADPASGATRNTIIFSAPLEFTKSNYLKFDF